MKASSSYVFLRLLMLAVRCSDLMLAFELFFEEQTRICEAQIYPVKVNRCSLEQQEKRFARLTIMKNQCQKLTVR